MLTRITLQGVYRDIKESLDAHVASCLPSNIRFHIHYDYEILDNQATEDGIDFWHVNFGCDDAPRACVAGLAKSSMCNVLRSAVNTSLKFFVSEQERIAAEGIATNYAIQVTNDFEELVWLRNLAEQFTYCDVRNSMRDVARSLLPSLRQVLNADYLEYVPGGSLADASARNTIVADGPCRFDRDVFEQLDALVAESRPESVYIYNASTSPKFKSGFPSLRTCMVCRLGVDDDFFGWIVALRYAVDEPQNTHTEFDDGEFGTFEAGLIQSAATLFQTHGRNVDLVSQKESLLVGAVRSLINSIDAKDPYTFGHSDRVAAVSQRIAIELGFEDKECQQIYMTGLLHDVGKIGIPDAILSKPSRLSDEEFAIIQQHPVIGYRILKNLQSLSYTFGGVLHHHESFDGTGYPEKLAGEDIPLYGRIIAIADSFDAMTSSRPYRQAMSFEKAESIIRGGAGKQWDPTIVDAFFAAIEDIRHMCEARSSATKDSESVVVMTDMAIGKEPSFATV